MPDTKQPTSKAADAINKVQEEIKKIPPTTDRNLLAALGYVWILGLVMLIIKRDDAFIQFHAKQGVVLFLISLVGFIPVIGWIMWALAVAGMVLGFIHAWQGKEYKLPYVYGWSQKIHL